MAIERHSIARPRAPIPLHDLIRDPILADAFRRAARDDGHAFALPAPDAPVIAGGAAEAREVAHV